MDIRPEQREDGSGIDAVLRAAFAAAGEATLVNDLRRAGDIVFSLAAVDQQRILGVAVFSRLLAPFRALALGPVAVAPEYQRTGIGGALIRDGLRSASRDGWVGVFVLGDPGYYGRFGFTTELARGFATPYAGAHFMALALGEPLPALTGPLVHPSAFGRL